MRQGRRCRRSFEATRCKEGKARCRPGCGCGQAEANNRAAKLDALAKKGQARATGREAAAERVRLAAAEKARREAAQQAKREATEKARLEAIERAKRKAAEKSGAHDAARKS